VELWPKDDAERRQWCESQSVRPEHHCCLDMAFAISRPFLTPPQGPNRIVDWIASWNEYRIPAAFDGYSSTVIRFCPWCGSRLSASRHDEWYRVLRGMGYSDPGGADDIPAEFESDRWWRSDAEPSAASDGWGG
jgi:hypothetical protein